MIENDIPIIKAYLQRVGIADDETLKLLSGMKYIHTLNFKNLISICNKGITYIMKDAMTVATLYLQCCYKVPEELLRDVKEK